MEHLERIGQIVSDYRLLRWLGGGSFGNVYLAERLHDGSQVAVKVLEIRLSHQVDLRAFVNEARTMRLRHPHIMPLLDFGLSRDDTPFLVMEYAPNGTLRNRHPKGSRLPLSQVVQYATQIGSALQYAHEHRLVHRDVKPENMLLRSDEVLLLSDFGIATAIRSTHSLNIQADIGGTVLYMAPEQVQGRPRPQSDQYALAVVIYEWLSGRCPFQGTAAEIAMQHVLNPPPSLIREMPGVPKEVEACLFQALAKNPDERFASVQAFMDTFQQISDLPTQVMPGRSSFPVANTLVSTPAAEATSLPTVYAVAQEALAQGGEPQTSSFFPQERILPVTPFPPTNHSTITPFPSTYPVPRRSRRLTKGYFALLGVVVILLLLSVTATTYWAVVVGGKSAHTKATPTGTASATPTTVRSVTPYNAAVAKQGIMFGVDAQHTHNNPYEHVLNGSNVSHLQQKWTALTGAPIYSSPAVANDLVYVGSEDGKLYAFDALTDQQKWIAVIGTALYSSPAVANGLVYVGSKDDKLYAFDALTGQQKWTAQTGASIGSSPAVANGLVYVGCRDHRLYAFNALTGEQRWAAQTGAPINSSPLVANGLVYVGSRDHKLYAFNALTGEQRWAALTGNMINSSPIVANGVVYIGSEDDKLYAFSL